MKNYELEELLNDSEIGIYVTTVDSLEVIYINDVLKKLVQELPDSLKNKKCYKILNGFDHQCPFCNIPRMQENKYLVRTFHHPLLDKTFEMRGTIKQWEGKPVHIEYVRDITNEIQQKVDRKKLDIALGNSNLEIWEYDVVEHKVIQQTKALNKYSAGQIIENVPESIIESGVIHPSSVEDYQEMHRKVDQGQRSVVSDICYINKNGGTTWKRCTYTTIFIDGQPSSAIGCAADITAQKEMEQNFNDEMTYIEAVQSEKLLVKVRSNITQNVVESYVADNNVGITTVNTPYNIGTEQLAQTGFTTDEQNMIRKYLDRNRVLEAFSKGETKYSIDYRRKAHDGSVIWVNTTVKTYQNPQNGDVMSFMYSYDINDEKTKEGIIEAVSSLEYDYIAYIDLNTKAHSIYYGCNDLVSRPTIEDDYTEDVTYKICKEIVVPEDFERALNDIKPETIQKNLKKHQIFSDVYSVYDKKNMIRHKQIQYAYLNEQQQQIVLTRTDVTDILDKQKQQQTMLETALLAAEQANSAKSDFLSRMSHEIRTPMNAIIGMSTIAAQSIGNDKQVADCISKIGISSRFLLSLINDILDMSRIESGKMLLKSEKIPFEEFLNGINSICISQANSKNICYENIVDPGIDDYYVGDAMKLQQVVINVLSNAIKFTPHNGKVTFSVKQTKKTKDAATLQFVINDTGCGISEEFMPNLFDAFAQEHSGNTAMYGGTGLGLAICKNLVDMMDGHINVRSIVGIGTEFTIDVKLGVTEESKNRYIFKQEFHFEKLHTLVVDDETTVCEHTVITLKEIGINAEWVDSGKKAISLIKNKWDNKQYYDFILVDWKMPDMDGIETTRQIRKIVGPDVTIIIMTAYDWTNIEYEAKMAGVNMLMSKPMFKSSLISAFQKALGKQVEDQTVVDKNFRFDGKRVLLAEDHPLNVEVAKKLLESKGFIVEHAENGLRALEMFTSTPVGYYDAILMDIRMPEMDGLQATYNIRRWTKEDAKTIPIIAMTANAFDDDVQKSRSAGMNAHLAKPIEPQLMYQTLYDFIFGESLTINQTENI